MGALDAKLREEIHIELRALQRRLGITTIMVTHDQAEAMTLADRVALVNRGCVEQMGKPYEMYEQPNGRFASTFLGHANVFSGSVSDDDFVVRGVALPAPPGASQEKPDYIVRPEKIEFAEQGPIVRGSRSARVFLGNHWVFQVETPLGSIQTACANTAPPSVGEGDEVGLRWDLRNARIVAPEGKAEIAIQHLAVWAELAGRLDGAGHGRGATCDDLLAQLPRPAAGRRASTHR